MTYSKLKLPRIPDAVAHQLETRILEGSLKPGDRLPAERELAIELGVSRPSLREAIKKLVSRDLLVSRHGGGTYVTDRLEASFIDPWQQLLRATPVPAGRRARIPPSARRVGRRTGRPTGNRRRPGTSRTGLRAP
ncbi:GntR family transcriptional regulator [Candidatus Accumulibacter necessarius]|jgi:GntR family transcriptional repressor for pyruvate dehydrogenase complex|uniref:GntR family transcriptional regulator n=1 Tax=Candidatus Accumulibacter necessarius TaxID=2954386 RepID=UPI003DA923D7